MFAVDNRKVLKRETRVRGVCDKVNATRKSTCTLYGKDTVHCQTRVRLVLTPYSRLSIRPISAHQAPERNLPAVDA